MVAIAQDGSITLANGRTADLYGYPGEDLIGLPGAKLVSEASLRALADSHADTTTPGEASINVTGRRRDGSEFPAEVRLSTLPAEGSTLRVAAIRDISERQERRGQFIGGVAHDFNNLLNVIQGYADFTAEQLSALAEEDARLRSAVEDIEQVRSAAQQAVRLTRQLLTVARHD